MKNLPPTAVDTERFSIPVPRVFIEGRMTVFENFGEITDESLRRLAR
jgi:translation initiation factor 2 beta subunit (eIF-2beta)/eIF-5